MDTPWAPSAELTGLVGRRASRTFWSARIGETCGEAMARLRSLAKTESTAMLQVCYVVDDEGHLVGCAPITVVASADTATPLGDVMNSRTIPIPEGAPEEAIQDFFVTYGLNSFPVVDKEKRLVGVVGIEHFSDLVFEGFEEQLREELCRSVGLNHRDEENSSAFVAARTRLPWLGITLAGGFIAAFALSEWLTGGLDQKAPLLFFLPLIVMLTERVTQRILTLRLTWDNKNGMQRRELLAETSLAIGMGIITAFITYLWKSHATLVLTVGGGSTASVLIGATVGLLFPINERGAKDFSPNSVPIALAVADIAAIAAFIALFSMTQPSLGVR